MSTSPSEYLDAMKKILNLESDNALAVRLGINRKTVSRYRLGIGTFDDDICHSAADILGIHPGIVLIHMNAARTRCPKTKRLWLDISTGFFKAVPPELDRRRAPR